MGLFSSLRGILISVSVTTLAGCGTMTAAPESDLTYQQVHEVELSQGEIFEKAQEWLAITFVDSKEVVEVASPDTGTIIGKGIVQISPTGIVGIPVRFTVRIDTKEGRYRSTYTNYVAYYGTARNQPVEVTDSRSAGQVNQRIGDLDADLLRYLETSSATPDDW
tara:strand:- start:783 stop:1274 length:492 start_codon:yes stop_codon:yes gene_type:complete